MMRDKADPPIAVGGLEGIGKRVGSWGKKKKVEGPPADLHPPLNETKVAAQWAWKMCVRNLVQSFAAEGGFFHRYGDKGPTCRIIPDNLRWAKAIKKHATFELNLHAAAPGNHRHFIEFQNVATFAIICWVVGH